jgi:hypothetical protein
VRSANRLTEILNDKRGISPDISEYARADRPDLLILEPQRRNVARGRA